MIIGVWPLAALGDFLLIFGAVADIGKVYRNWGIDTTNSVGEFKEGGVVKTRFFSLSGIFLLVGLLLAGCATPPPKVTVDAAEVQQEFKGKTVKQAMADTEAAMARAEQEELAFYSPGFFAVAQQALKDAQFLALAPKESPAEGRSAEQNIFTKLSLADKSLAQAEATKPEVKKRLGDILKVRESLIAKGIDQSQASEFQDLMNSLMDLFRRIEKNNFEGFEHAKAVTLRQFRRLEAQSVKAMQLDDSIAVLEKAEAMGAGGAAPKSYQKARQALRNAQAVIERDPNDQAAIKDAVERFTFEARHLVHVTKEVKELRALNRAAMENILLAAELRLLAISDALHQPDPREYDLREQAEMTLDAAEKLFAAKSGGGAQPPARPINKNELDEAHAKIEQLQAQLEDSRAKNVALVQNNTSLNKRIDALERVVIKLNNKITTLEDALAKAAQQTAPPAEGVEITPVNK